MVELSHISTGTGQQEFSHAQDRISFLNGIWWSDKWTFKNLPWHSILKLHWNLKIYQRFTRYSFTILYQIINIFGKVALSWI